MKTGKAAKILNVSNVTIHNWVKNGRLKLNKVLPNGYIDINDESVYDTLSSVYKNECIKNKLIIILTDNNVLKFDLDDSTI